MALGIDFCVTQQPACKYLSFKDETGVYDAVYNTGGYGSPNPNTTDALTATLVVILPDNTTTGTINLFPLNMPDTSGIEIYITNTMLGLGSDSLPNGIYTWTYTVTGNNGTDFTATKTIKTFVDCQAQCCVDKMFCQVELSTCDCCANNKLDSALIAQGWLDSANHAFNCGKPKLAKQLLKKVEQLCTLIKCSSC